MKRIKPTPNAHQWPRSPAPTIECRPRDLVIRIADWSRQSPQTGEPSYDVEVYIGGVYDWNESTSCTFRKHKTKEAAKAAAIKHAKDAIARLL